MTKNNNESENKFTKETRRKYKDIIKPITSQIQAALILYKLKTWNNWQADTSQLSYDENRKITEIKWKDAPKKGAVDVIWNIEDINIINISNQAYEQIDNNSKIEKSDKELLKEWIKDFITKAFFSPRLDLERKKHLPHKKFRNYYREYAKSLVKEWKLSQKEWTLYSDICIAIANILYDKNHDYLDKDWQISQLWLQYIWHVFLKTIKNIPNSGSSKSFHKIFHDWDFNFLRNENSRWEPTIWTLDHYVKNIMYLMNQDNFNAYEEWDEAWQNERYVSRKSFLNNLFATIYLKDEHKRDKWIIHRELSQIWSSNKDSIEDAQNRDLTARYKTDGSKMLKIWWRTKEIKDESWIRATYYWPSENTENIKDSIISLCKNYFREIFNTKWIYIESIQTDRKWNFISKEDENQILEDLENYLSNLQDGEIEITKRVKPWTKNSKLENISQIYRSLTKKNPSQWMREAYNIASWTIKRWANGQYEDFKLIIKFSIIKDEYNEWRTNEHIDEDITLFQEMSFYPHNNDIWIWNHNFLDLEKRIFNRVKTMSDPWLWKSISLNRLRLFTESTIKDISFEIDIYEDKIKRWVLPKPENDDYKYLILDGEKLPLDGLTYRTKENNDRFDELIPLILNYFIKKNKIFYINKENDWFHWLITASQLHDKNAYKIRRFSTSDTLRNTALDTNYERYNICFYADDKKWYWYPNFYVINLWDLWNFISLENFVK